MIIECKVIKVIEIGLHTEFIGEIIDVKADESVLDSNKMPDVEKLKPIIWTWRYELSYGWRRNRKSFL